VKFNLAREEPIKDYQLNTDTHQSLTNTRIPVHTNRIASLGGVIGPS